MLFDDGYQERYLDSVCDSPEMIYDNLPVMDGNRWSGNGVRAGCYFMRGKETLAVTSVDVLREDDEELVILLSAESGSMTIRFTTESIGIYTDIADLTLQFRWGKSVELDAAKVAEKQISLVHEGFDYAVQVPCGTINNMSIAPEDGRISIRFD